MMLLLGCILRRGCPSWFRGGGACVGLCGRGNSCRCDEVLAFEVVVEIRMKNGGVGNNLNPEKEEWRFGREGSWET